MSGNNSSTMDVLFAFMLGGVVGAALAVLLTPYTGEEARKRLKESLENYEGRAKQTLGEAKGHVHEGVEEIKRAVHERKDELRAAYEAGREAYYREKKRLLEETS